VSGDRTKSLHTLSERLGHAFARPELLQRALTHSSARNRGAKSYDYERLEFLGDRVLGLVIAEMLIERFPDAREGDLARRFNRLVRKETCADVAESLGLGAFVIMSTSEAESGGRGKQTILGDACEAILGAVFRDGGYEAARSIIHALWSERVDKDSAPLRDAKSALQEWVQGKGLPLPHYTQTGQEGPDHAPQFTTSVTVEGLDSAVGFGFSKRAAEQAAATAMLQREGVWKVGKDD
jgi:ribonuclease-3